MNPKIEKLLDEILDSSFISENIRSEDYCIYCDAIYGNYQKFGFANKTVQDNHEEDCIYRLAYEIRNDPHQTIQR
jgi:hypothetical protein